MAQALAGSPAAFDSQGLQHPAIDPIMIMSALGGPSIARALAGMAESAPQILASQAGAIFPEGVPLSELPQGKAAMQELGQILPDAQKAFRSNEALSNWHAENMDFPAVLKDKWALLKNSAGNY